SDLHCVLLGAVFVLTDVDALVEVEDDPDVGRGIELEELDHELTGPRGGGPVDAVEAVARLVVADARGVGRHVVGALAETTLSRQVRRRDVEVRQLSRRRVDEDALGTAERAAVAEEAEGVARRDLHGPNGEEPAASADRRRLPATRFAWPQRD